MVGFTTLARRLPRGREHHGGFGKQLHSRSLQCAHYHPQRSVTARARGRGGNSPDDQQEESKPDIDLLAKMLSQQAAKLRASLEEEESPEGFVDAPRVCPRGLSAAYRLPCPPAPT